MSEKSKKSHSSQKLLINQVDKNSILATELVCKS